VLPWCKGTWRGGAVIRTAESASLFHLARERAQKRVSPTDSSKRLPCDQLLSVGASGFEPPTSWSRTRRANRAAPRPEYPAKCSIAADVHREIMVRPVMTERSKGTRNVAQNRDLGNLRQRQTAWNGEWSCRLRSHSHQYWRSALPDPRFAVTPPSHGSRHCPTSDRAFKTRSPGATRSSASWAAAECLACSSPKSTALGAAWS
jgi:hypothetical protein